MPDIRTETMTVNMGPQHPSTHGVLRLVLELDGETVRSCAPTIGYLHTGIEKTAEQKKWQQVIPLVERMDYLSAQSNSMAFCLSVEKLLGLEIPERVTNIRLLIAELQRINSHLVWLGTHGMEVGAVSVMLYCFRERELLLNINEMLALMAWSDRLPARPASTTTCAGTSRISATRPTTSPCRRRRRATSTRGTRCGSPRCARA
jgi:NADH-quinone oxidoreductase subunit D